MTWRMARSLDVLLNEVNRAAPDRNKASDGGVGDAAHATRTSDHNPWVTDSNGVGVVRARDFTHDPGDLDAEHLAAHLAEHLGRHPALGSGAYVIWDWLIISTDRLAEGWRPYTGSNGHTKHVHISVGTTGYDNTQGWNWPPTQEEWFDVATKDELRAVVAEEIKKHFAREKARDQREKARDQRRHHKVMAAIRKSSIDPALIARVEAALTDDDTQEA